MKAIENIYKLLSINKEEDFVNAMLEINFSHEVFRGHFPDKPVLPGVCTLGIIKDLIKKTYNLGNFDFRIKEIKYLTLVTPKDENLMIVEFNKNGDNFVGMAKYNNDIAAKFNLSLDSQVVD